MPQPFPIVVPALTKAAPSAAPRGYLGFGETDRYVAALPDGEVVGEVWRGLRMDGVVCWMVRPEWLEESMPHRRVISGYSRTSRKGAAEELGEWAALRRLRMDVDGFALHCCRAFDHGNHETRSYLVVGPGGHLGYISLKWNREPNWTPGATEGGGVGWHACTYRGRRMVCVNDCGDAEQAMAIALEAMTRPRTPEEARQDNAMHAATERYYGSPEARAESRRRLAAVFGPAALPEDDAPGGPGGP
jgi:hypothetical protein